MTLGDGHYCDRFFSSASKLKTPVEGGITLPGEILGPVWFLTRESLMGRSAQ